MGTREEENGTGEGPEQKTATLEKEHFEKPRSRKGRAGKEGISDL